MLLFAHISINCCEVWDVFGETQSKRLQKLQKRAARIIMNMSNDIDHSVALQTLSWVPLKTERKKAKAKMMYKLLNNMGPESLTNLFTYKSEMTNYNLRNISSSLSLPKPRTNNMKKSFMYDGAYFWNSVPKEIRESKSLLENAKTTISPPPQRIIWCYGQWQPMYLEMIKTIPGIELNEGIPSDIDSGEFLDVSTRNLIVLDDLMTQSGEDKRIADLFTKESHHRNLSVIYIVQNIFQQGRETRNISLNAHYIVLFKSLRDKQQISVLARQVNPGHVQEFMKSYEEATKRPHGYLMLDLKPTTDDQHRLKSNVLREENIVGQQNLDHYTRKRSYQQQPIADDQHQLKSNVPPKENTIGQQNLHRYIQKRSYEQSPMLNAMYNSDQQMKQIVQAPFLTPDEKSTLYSLMNYTVSNHSKINSKMNSALKIIFKHNFRVS